MIETKDIDTFLCSPIARTMEAEYTTPPFIPTSKEMFNNMRDYLILRILLANGQRTGAMLNITEECVRKATVRTEGAVLVVIICFGWLFVLSLYKED